MMNVCINSFYYSSSPASIVLQLLSIMYLHTSQLCMYKVKEHIIHSGYSVSHNACEKAVSTIFLTRVSNWEIQCC